MAPTRGLRRLPAAVFLAGLGLLAAACSPAPARCVSIADTNGEASVLPAGTATLGFEPQSPCGHRDDLIVERAWIDRARIHFAVSRRGEQAFTLSETREEIPFTAIPQGSHWLREEAEGVAIAGFAGPSGGGSDIAYLRWRIDGITFELAASLRPWLRETDLTFIAAAMVRERRAH